MMISPNNKDILLGRGGNNNKNEGNELLISPNSKDILLGRGGNNNKNEGNELLRNLCRAKASEYTQSSKKERANIINHLLEETKSSTRFLFRSKITGHWEKAEKNTSREKVSRTLRNCVYELERKAKQRAIQESHSASVPTSIPSPSNPYEKDSGYFWLLKTNKYVRGTEEFLPYAYARGQNNPEPESYLGTSCFDVQTQALRKQKRDTISPIFDERANTLQIPDQDRYAVSYIPTPSQSVTTSLKKRYLQHPSFITIQNESRPNKRTRYEPSYKNEVLTTKSSRVQFTNEQRAPLQPLSFNDEVICIDGDEDTTTIPDVDATSFTSEQNIVSPAHSEEEDDEEDDDDSSCLSNCSTLTPCDLVHSGLNPEDLFQIDDVALDQPVNCSESDEDSLIDFLDQLF